MRIFYAGEFRFPRGCAYSPRAVNIGKALSASGDELFFRGVPSEGSSGETGKTPFPYLNPSKRGNRLARLMSYLFFGIQTEKIMKQKQIGSQDGLIVAGGYSRALLPLLLFCYRRKVKLFVDVVEWFDYSTLPLGKFGPFAWDVDFALRRLIPRTNGVIVISRYLEEYYRSHGCRVLRIPQVVDLAEEKWNRPRLDSYDAESLNLVYAGVPGKKDLIERVIRAVAVLAAEGEKIKLHLLGPSEKDLEQCRENPAELVKQLLNKNLFLYGRIPQDEVPSHLQRADFSILVRPDERYANAGFPTKLVESFAAGVPMISNLTSDIGLYLHDGETGLVAESPDAEALERVLRRALRLSHGEIRTMRENARRKAESAFDFHNYIESLREFIHSTE